MSASEFLAEYAQSVTIDDLSDHVVDMSERLLIDSIGCCLGALDAPPVTKLRSLYGKHVPHGYDGTIMGTDNRVPAEYAALINGVMVRYLDFNDDWQSPTGGAHPSDQIPTLLAVAEAEGASGEELIEAMTVGYEVQCGGVDTGIIRPEGWDYVTWGTHGATVAVGKLMGLSTEEIVNALGIAVTSQNALEIARLGEVTNWKGAAQAFGCHNAVHACQMAREGITGPSEVYEGEHGFFDVVARGPVALDEYVGADETPRITRTNFKSYPACYSTSTSIDAILELMETHDFGPDDIESISVETYSKAVQIAATPEKWSTDLSRESADHSLPYVVSVAILEGEVMPRHYEPEWLQNERVHGLMGKISVDSTDEMDEFKKNNPQCKCAWMEVETTDGTYEKRLDYPRGHAKNPISNEEIEEKMRALGRPHLSDERIQQTSDQCYDIANVDDVGVLVRNLAE